MKHLSARLAFASLAPIALVVLAACASNKTEAAPPRGCVQADCAAGNKCINNGTDTKCRLGCAAHKDCPTNYQCATITANPNAPPPTGPVVDPSTVGAFCSNVGGADGMIFGYAGNADCAATGGVCVADGTRKVTAGGNLRNDQYCSASCEAAACPPGWDCVDNGLIGSPPAKICAKAVPAYCVKNTTEVPTGQGQFGNGCLPTDGEAGNKACDTANKFICYGTGPTDANAYCTLTGCTTDLDCTGGFWCGTVDNAPNVKAAERSFGASKTRTVCLKHEYCSPCVGDLDCPVIDGKQSRCADDLAGGKYCATVCTATTECRLDAACNNPLADGTKVCAPRAGTCKGDGSLCSPCRSDADCTDGYCIKGNYTPERFCSVKAKSPCMPMVKGDCPTFTTVKGTQIGCQSVGDENIPKDQCIGIVEFGESGDIGCYTKHP